MTRALATIFTAALLLVGAGCGGSDGSDGDPRGAYSDVIVVAIGDSITTGAPLWDPNPQIRDLIRPRGQESTPRSQYEYWAERKLGVSDVRNCGVGGEPTDKIALRFDLCVTDADVVIIQGGGNDLFGRRPPAEVARNLEQMVIKGKRRGLRVLLAEVVPIGPEPLEPPLPPNIRRPTRELNRLIHRIGRRHDVRVLPFHEALEDPRRPGTTRPEYLSSDGIHPSVAGYRRLGELVEISDLPPR